MLWNGSIWKPDETLAVFTNAQSICRETAKRAKPRVALTLSSARTATAVVTMAKWDQRLAMVPAQFDADPWALVASTQTVDLRTGACRPPRPEDYATKRAASACAAPSTPCPLWMAFLQRVTNNDDELISFLQRFLGYCLTGTTDEQVLAFLYGSGANGKTVFTSTVSGILGDYAAAAPMAMLLTAKGERHETEIAKLAGARLVTAHETGGGRRWDEARIKQLTGSDRLTARFMRQDYFDFDPTFKLLVTGNHKPTLRTLDVAVRRRFLLVPFIVQIPPAERDPQLVDKLKAEWPEILRWMVDGCLEWQRIGLAVPDAVRDASNAYFADQDTLGQWIEEALDRTDPRAWTRTVDLFTAWKEWAEQRNLTPGSMKSFVDEFDNREFVRKQETGTRRAGYSGVTFRAGRTTVP
jgi:putative DNA primase/helicase